MWDVYKNKIIDSIPAGMIDEGIDTLNNTKRNTHTSYWEDNLPLCVRGEINHIFISPTSQHEIDLAKSICTLCNRWDDCIEISMGDDCEEYYGIIGGIYHNIPLIDILLNQSLTSDDDGRRDKNNLIRVKISSQSDYGGERGYYYGYVRDTSICIVCGEEYKKKRRDTITCGRRCGGIYRHNKSKYDDKRNDDEDGGMIGEREYNDGRRDDIEDDGRYPSWGIVWDGGEEREYGRRGKLRRGGRNTSSHGGGNIDGEYWYNQ